MVLTAGAAVYLLGKHWISVDEALGLCLGAAIGSVIDPDLRDMHNITTHSERRVWAIPLVGPVVGLLWESYWYPMARIIPHRSIWSHLPVFATGVAALYLFVPIMALVYLLFVSVAGLAGYLPWLISLLQAWMLFTFIGWCVQDTIHFIQDKGNLEWPQWWPNWLRKGKKRRKSRKSSHSHNRKWSTTPRLSRSD